MVIKRKRLFDQPEAVIKRWASIKAIRLFRPYIEGFFLYKLRLTLILSERKRKKVLVKTMSTTVREYRKINKTNFSKTKDIFNISLFLLLAERDLQAIKVDAFSHPDPWKRNLSLRVMLLIIHERDISKVASGNKMKEIYSQLDIDDGLKMKITSSLRQINKVHVKVKKQLSEIRNSTIAHRDGDSMLQYEVIEKLSIDQTKGLVTEYYEASNNFMSLLTQLLLDASSFRSMINQYSNANSSEGKDG